jgi:GTP-binding protein
MIIQSATFLKSCPSIKFCPEPSKPEFAFIGRSNVGKSSLINMLTGWSKLAKTSGQPGKTQTINYFTINDNWYLVDLPGYGYAKVSQKKREIWNKAVGQYILKRVNLLCLFVLIDSRITAQESDLRLMELLGLNEIPFVRVFTKTDKLTATALKRSISQHDQIMSENWESLPVTFITSAINKTGREDILNYIEESKTFFKNTR